MSDSGSIFRSAAFGGFNKQDVLSYIEEKNQAHTKEINELRRALEQSRRELDEARDELSLSSASIGRLQAELDGLRSEKEQLEEKWNDVNSRLAEIEHAKILVADIELGAYTRAKKIEDAAIENASMARAALTNLFQDAKKRFDNTKESASRTLQRIAQELDRLKEVLNHLPGSFDAISSEIEALKFGSDKKNPESVPDVQAENTDGPLNEMQYESIVYPVDPSVDVTADEAGPLDAEDPEESDVTPTGEVPEEAEDFGTDDEAGEEPEEEASQSGPSDTPGESGYVFTFDPPEPSEPEEE